MNRIAIVLAVAIMILAFPESVPANEPKAVPKADPARTMTATDKAKAKTLPSAALPPDILQRRRRGIAAMLEGNIRFRGALLGGAAKIANAKLAGPFEHTYPRIFSATDTTVTLYCATATLPSGSQPSAMITVVHPPQGGERLIATLSHLTLHPLCRNADFKPFPELEQLREQRRRALGYGD